MGLKTTVATLILGVLAVPASASASSIVLDCFDVANLCSVNPDTLAQRQLTTDGQAGTSNVYGGPSLSPDGTKLAFVFNNQLIVGDANASNRSAPFPGSTSAFAALMRPDGGAVAEVEQTFSAIPYEVCTYNLDGSGRDCYWGTKGPPGWAPDNGPLISVGGGPPNYLDQIDHCPVAAGSCSVEAADPENNLFDPAVSPAARRSLSLSRVAQRRSVTSRSTTTRPASTSAI
jgi:hypothetical protein